MIRLRVFQQYATLDGYPMAAPRSWRGRGSFIESFPLFGYDLNDYDTLFAEKLDLLLKLRDYARVSWQGEMRPPLQDVTLYPRPEQEKLPVWIAVGGTPQSVMVRAASLDCRWRSPSSAATRCGSRPISISTARPWAQVERKPEDVQLSLNMHGFVAETTQAAKDIFFERTTR